MHDAVILYSLAVNETLAENGDVTDGMAMTRKMWNRTFEGEHGSKQNRLVNRKTGPSPAKCGSRYNIWSNVIFNGPCLSCASRMHKLRRLNVASIVQGD